jgi:hypothetical protein
MDRLPDPRVRFIGVVVAGGVVLAVVGLSAASVRPSAAELDPASPPDLETSTSSIPPSPTSPSSSTRAFSEVGFQLVLPDGWSVREETADTVELAGEGSQLTVRVGDSDGRILTCDMPDRPWERCRDVTITTLDEFKDAVKQDPVEGCSGLCAPSAGGRPATLAGEEAWLVKIYGYEYPAHGGENALYVLALHGGRPYFLRFHTSANFAPGSPPGSRWDFIVDSFQFVDEGTVGPTLSPPAFQTISSGESGFEFEAPGSWAVRRDDDPLVVSVAGPGGRLTIRSGDDASRILNCGDPSGAPCTWVSVQSLQELVELLAPASSTYWGTGATKVSQRELTIGGESASRVIVEEWPGRAYGGRVKYYFVAIHDGRPLIMAWNPTGDGGQILGGILNSFRFPD